MMEADLKVVSLAREQTLLCAALAIGLAASLVVVLSQVPSFSSVLLLGLVLAYFGVAWLRDSDDRPMALTNAPLLPAGAHHEAPIRTVFRFLPLLSGIGVILLFGYLSANELADWGGELALPLAAGCNAAWLGVEVRNLRRIRAAEEKSQNAFWTVAPRFSFRRRHSLATVWTGNASEGLAGDL